MFFAKLTLLKIKRMLRLLPGIMAGALALCFVMGVFAYGAGRLLYKENTVQKQNIAIVRPEEDKYIDLALNMVKNIDSVESLCSFTYLESEEEAVERLNNGSMDAAVILPYRFIQDIVHGKNTPARIILPKAGGLYTTLFKNLADNGIGMLADVQAAVQGAYYAAEDENYAHLEEKNEDFNMTYFDIFLPREKLVSERPVSAVGSLTAAEYYGAMAASVLLLLCGMCLSCALGEENKSFCSLARAKGVGNISSLMFISDNITAAVFYIILLFIMAMGLYAAGIDFRLDLKALFLTVILASATVSVIYTLFSRWWGALALFVLTLASALVGGAVLPVAFLPKGIGRLSSYSPVYLLFDCLSDTFGEAFTLTSPKICCIFLLGLYLMAGAALAIRRAAEK